MEEDKKVVEEGAPDQKRARVDEDENGSSEKFRTRKVVVLFGYNGSGYQGMQRNPGVKTIEDVLLDAFFKAGCIKEKGLKVPQDIFFQRTARTDKGVHAVRQVVSLKMGHVDNDSEANESRDRINAVLPSHIRVFWITRVTKSFNCKDACSARRYEYLLPAYAFTPRELRLVTDYRIKEDQLTLFRKVLQSYVGTHNFHNFTSDKKASDPSAKRYIMSFECSEPFMQGNVQWVRCTVRGQSFMIHQIRKMIGLAVVVVRGYTSYEFVEQCFSDRHIDIPKIPGLGLVLDSVYFDHYNRKFGKDGSHTKLEWDQFTDVIEPFKADVIVAKIVETEHKEKQIWNWLTTNNAHTFDKSARYAAAGLPAAGDSSDDEAGASSTTTTTTTTAAEAPAPAPAAVATEVVLAPIVESAEAASAAAEPMAVVAEPEKHEK